MTIFFKKHNLEFYNTLLTLSRNIFFYKKVKLADTFETRVYLIFLHFSILMIITKYKGIKFSQDLYDNLFNSIEYNLRELGFGDITVNKKMKELNKIFYDILLKINLSDNKSIKINHKVVFKYFKEFENLKSDKYTSFESYFSNFFYFCFELPIESMLEEAINFKDKSWQYQKEKPQSPKKE